MSTMTMIGARALEGRRFFLYTSPRHPHALQRYGA
jgi:hypothetical protein